MHHFVTIPTFKAYIVPVFARAATGTLAVIPCETHLSAFFWALAMSSLAS